MTIRVLIVDDSATMRAVIHRKLSTEQDIEVVGLARDAMEARQLIKQHNPDVVTLDIEMPGMDGLSFLEKIMALRPTPVVIVSGSTQEGARATIRALKLGAVDCYAKYTEDRSIADDDGGELARIVRSAASLDLASSQELARPRHSASSSPLPPVHHPRSQKPELIVIGASTGGIEALHTLLRDFPEDCPPTLIVQHVNATFAPAIVQSLSKVVRPSVALADSDVPLDRGMILLAPGNTRHLGVAAAGSRGYRAVLRADEPVAGHRPSVDWLFMSAARTLGPLATAILLTGMGQDGANGMHAMVQAGAHTIAQDRDSCVVFGMPRAAIELGAAQEILPLGDIAAALFEDRMVV